MLHALRQTVLAAIALASFTLPGVAMARCPDGTTIHAETVTSVEDLFDARARLPAEQLNFSGLRLEDADFAGRDLSRMCFDRADLPSASFAGAQGDGLAFHESNLLAANFESFRGRGVLFRQSSLERASLRSAWLPDVSFDTVILMQLDARGAVLSGGSVSGHALSAMQGALFDRADMRGFIFRCGIGQEDNCGSSSERVSLRGADLSGAALLMASKTDWDLAGTRIADTRMHLMHLDWLRGSDIAGPVVVAPASWAVARNINFGAEAPSAATVRLQPRELRTIWAAKDRLAEPGFACAAAASRAERYICDTRMEWRAHPSMPQASWFAAADRDLNRAYRAALRVDPSLVASQRAWIAERDACLDDAEQDEWETRHCVHDAYRLRSETLWRIAAPRHGMVAGTARIYVDAGTADFLTELPDDRLRAKLTLPALWNAWQMVQVERDRAGRLFARGSSIGPNYHLGHLGSPEEGMLLAPDSGFYGAQDDCLPSGVTPILRFRGPYLDTGAERPSDDCFNGFISTGARAGFGEFVLLAAD